MLTNCHIMQPLKNMPRFTRRLMSKWKLHTVSTPDNQGGDGPSVWFDSALSQDGPFAVIPFFMFGFFLGESLGFYRTRRQRATVVSCAPSAPNKASDVYPSSGRWILIKFWKGRKKESIKPLVFMVSAGPIRERSRMIGKANVETSQFVKNLASPCVASQKAKIFGRCMSWNCAWRYHASQCCILRQSL